MSPNSRLLQYPPIIGVLVLLLLVTACGGETAGSEAVEPLGVLLDSGDGLRGFEGEFVGVVVGIGPVGGGDDRFYWGMGFRLGDGDEQDEGFGTAIPGVRVGLTLHQ